MDDSELQEELERLQEEDEELQKKEWESASEVERASARLEEARQAVRAFMQEKENSIKAAENSLRYAQAGLRGAEIQRLESELESVGIAKKRLEDIDPEITKALQNIEQGTRLLSTLEAEQEELKNEGEAAASEVASHTTTLKALQRQEGLLRDNHGSKCNTCNQDLTPEMAESLFRVNRQSQEEEQAALQAAQKRVEELRASYAAKGQRINSGRGYISAQESLRSNLVAEKRHLQGTVQQEARLGEALAAAQEAHNKALQQIEVHQEELEKACALTVPVALTNDVEDALENIKKIEEGKPTTDFDYSGRTKISKIERELSRRATVLEKEARFDVEYERLLQEHSAVVEDLEHHKILLAEFSPTGLPALIMAGLVQELEDEINFHLERFSDGKFSVNLETQREKRDGTVDERIDVTINAPDGTRDYVSFSGGERFRIDLAVHIALCEISARRKGTDAVKTIVIDEGFGALDAEGIRQAVSALREVSEEMNVIAISHVDAVKEAFTHVVEVANEGGFTYIHSVS